LKGQRGWNRHPVGTEMALGGVAQKANDSPLLMGAHLRHRPEQAARFMTGSQVVLDAGLLTR